MDVARLLLAAKPPASTRVRDRRGQYPIHRAAAVGSVPMTTLLLRNRSPLNPTDGEGFTPLHHAVAEGHGACCPRPLSLSPLLPAPPSPSYCFPRSWIELGVVCKNT